MSDEPTIYSVVMEERTDELFTFLDSDVKRRLAEFRMGFAAAYEETIRKAYVRGVADGFAQGVAAAEKAKP